MEKEKIAFIIGEHFVYWGPVILGIAAFAAICLFVALHMDQTKQVSGTFLTAALAVALSLVLSRLVHWYCRPDNYASLAAAMTDHSSGGYALIGVFVGCAAAAGLVRLTGLCKNLPLTLDCMALAGALGMCVGRLSHFFNAFDRGQVVESIQTLPLVYPVENATSGALEYRLATFMLQSIVAGVLFLVLTVFYFVGKHRRTLKDGDTCLLFLLCHGATQVLLDSTRYDSLFLRSNGFVSLVQIAGAVGIALAVVLFSVRLVRACHWKWWFLAFWVGIVGLLTCAGIMEYFVQRRSNDAAFYYNFMSISLISVIAVTVVIRYLAARAENRNKRQSEMIADDMGQAS